MTHKKTDTDAVKTSLEETERERMAQEELVKEMAVKKAEEDKIAKEKEEKELLEKLKVENEELKKQMEEGKIPMSKGLTNPNQQPGYSPEKEGKEMKDIQKKVEEMDDLEVIKEYDRLFREGVIKN